MHLIWALQYHLQFILFLWTILRFNRDSFSCQLAGHSLDLPLTTRGFYLKVAPANCLILYSWVTRLLSSAIPAGTSLITKKILKDWLRISYGSYPNYHNLPNHLPFESILSDLAINTRRGPWERGEPFWVKQCWRNIHWRKRSKEPRIKFQQSRYS